MSMASKFFSPRFFGTGAGNRLADPLDMILLMAAMIFSVLSESTAGFYSRNPKLLPVVELSTIFCNPMKADNH